MKILLNVFYQKNKARAIGRIIIFFCALCVFSPSTHGQKKNRSHTDQVRDQFPIKKMWDEAVAESRKSGRPALVFNVDYVDSLSIQFRDKILRDLGVQKYLNNNFELGVNDFSVDPEPTVGLDSLRKLGLRLDGLEKGYKLPSRPTAIMLRGDSTEIDRIVHPERLTPQDFISTLEDYKNGNNSLAEYRKKYWADPGNDSIRLAYINKLADHSVVDSILWHLSALAKSSSDPGLSKLAAKEHAFMQFQMTSSPRYIDEWITSLDARRDSLEIFNALSTLLEFHQRTKRVDNITAMYERIFAFTGEKDPDLLNNLAWDLANFSTRYDSAMTYVNDAITKDGTNPSYYDTRALIHFLQEDFDSAAKDTRRAMELSTTSEDKAYYKERAEFYEKEARDKREFLADPEKRK